MSGNIIDINFELFKQKNAMFKNYDMSKILKCFGYTVLAYDELFDIIEILELEEYANSHKGFAILNKNLVMYDPNLNYDEKQFVLAHELGHIILFKIYGYEILNFSKWENEYYANMLANNLSLILKVLQIQQLELCQDNSFFLFGLEL